MCRYLLIYQLASLSIHQHSQQPTSYPYNNQPQPPMHSEPSEHSLPPQLPLLDQFKQQMLKAWQPVPSLTKTIIMFLLLACIFLGLGIPMIILSTNIQQYSIRYDNICGTGPVCSVSLNIGMDMVGPVFVYYQLRNYYQNHRLYAGSISDAQLKGKTISESTANSDCAPIVYNRQLYVNVSIDGTQLNPDAIAYPCGIVAYTYFNDSFVLQNGPVISDQNIAWPSDMLKYKTVNKSQAWIDIGSERFLNWIRVASMPNFRKLWGRVDGDLIKGVYTVNIANKFDVSKFHGEKYFVVSQSNFFGSKNHFLSITYLVVGSLCLVIGVAFLVKKLLKDKRD